MWAVVVAAEEVTLCPHQLSRPRPCVDLARAAAAVFHFIRARVCGRRSASPGSRCAVAVTFAMVVGTYGCAALVAAAAANLTPSTPLILVGGVQSSAATTAWGSWIWRDAASSPGNINVSPAATGSLWDLGEPNDGNNTCRAAAGLCPERSVEQSLAVSAASALFHDVPQTTPMAVLCEYRAPTPCPSGFHWFPDTDGTRAWWWCWCDGGAGVAHGVCVRVCGRGLCTCKTSCAPRVWWVCACVYVSVRVCVFVCVCVCLYV